MIRVFTKKLLPALFVGSLAGMLMACEEQGPAEEIGESIDDAAEEAGDAIEDAADEAEEAVN